MVERREVYESLDLALRIGEVQLSSGAGAADVTATMLALTHACGLRNVSADVTFVDLTLHHQPSTDEPVAVRVRRVTRRQVDYADLTEVDETVSDLIGGRHHPWTRLATGSPGSSPPDTSDHTGR